MRCVKKGFKRREPSVGHGNYLLLQVSDFASVKQVVWARSHFLPAAMCLSRELQEHGQCQADCGSPLAPANAKHGTGALKLLVSEMNQWMARLGREGGAPAAGPGPGARKERATRRQRPRELAGEESGGRLRHSQTRRGRGPGLRGLRAGGAGLPARHRELGKKAETRGWGGVLGPGWAAQSLTAVVARLCMLGAAAALLPPPDTPDPRPSFSASAAEADKPPQPPSASGWLRPFAAPLTFHPWPRPHNLFPPPSSWS